jgi:hypothetical protein
MTPREAKALRDEMLDEDYHGEVKQIGNGEHVVMINSTFLWGRADWRAYKRGTLPALEARQQEKVETKG